MGITLYLLWGKRRQADNALAAFTVQLALNVVWSVVFFGAQELFYRFLNIVALWAAILVTIALSFRVSRNSAALLVSYLFWVTIASALNYYVWVLNA